MVANLTNSNIVLSTKQYKVIGTRPIRHDGTDRVTGRAMYGADIKLPGTLTCKVLRSPHAHARIKSINTRKAEALPGVKAVVTAKDLPRLADKVEQMGESAVNLRFLSDNILARDKALYRGHAVAAVAATDQYIAEEALKLIEVEYEVLPAVLNVLDAMRDDAPLLHEDFTMKEFGKDTGKRSNIASRDQFIKGDVKAGFAQADVVIEREFDTATVHQGYIEPHAVTAFWNADGRLTVWASTQGAFLARDTIAQVLDIPVSEITYIPTEIGGGFGGKINLYAEPLCALLSRKTGKPVKSVMTRAEVLEGTGPTPGTHMRVKIGATKDGKITAAEGWFAYEAGAYPGSAIGAGLQCAFAPYDLLNGLLDGFDVVVNKPKSAAYRAPGAPQSEFAVECVVDEICEKIGMDPIEFRLKNAAKEGTVRVDGPTFPRIGGIECLEAAKAHEHYRAPLGGPNRGRGMAIGFWFNVGLASSCTISVNNDGAVNLLEGSSDLAGSRTAVSMQAAEILGIGVYDVHPKVGDTDEIGWTHVSGGSRTTYATGIAAIEASYDVIRQMKDRAALMWETSAENVDFADGVFTLKANPKEKLTFKEVAAKLMSTGGPLVGRATVDPTGHGGAFAVHLVDVEVDPETGKTQVLRYTAIQDAGKAVHPSYVEGQIQGGVVQGVGYALNEEYFYDEKGRMMNTSLLDYRMPTALDLPMISTVIVEVANPGHPFGVRGVGEVPIVPPLAAIANAVSHATGVRMNRLPMNPGHILETLLAKKNGGRSRK